MARRPIYYDTETTGVNSKKDRIVEIAAYDPQEDRTFVELVNPEMPIPAEAAAIHGISDEMVANAPTFVEVGASFAEFCSGDVYLIAHNNDAFDIHFLKEEFSRAELPWPEHWRFLDSLKWSRKFRTDLPRHALQFLREVYGFEANNAHRALDDVIILHKVFSAIIDDLPLEQVEELLSQTFGTYRMPFGKHRGKSLDQIPPDYFAWLAKKGAFDKPENRELKEQLEKQELLPAAEASP